MKDGLRMVELESADARLCVQPRLARWCLRLTCCTRASDGGPLGFRRCLGVHN